ncbi:MULTISPECIES: hypothetical protein [unclassified Streptomyces]|uniref:hypothetical protein n=1 Tax=unclassified Streptomyces TaxID=2593676 RepID=UPI0033AB46B3
MTAEPDPGPQARERTPKRTAARLLSRPMAPEILAGSIRSAAGAFRTALPLLMTAAAFTPRPVQPRRDGRVRPLVPAEGRDTVRAGRGR